MGVFSTIAISSVMVLTSEVTVPAGMEVVEGRDAGRRAMTREREVGAMLPMASVMAWLANEGDGELVPVVGARGVRAAARAGAREGEGVTAGAAIGVGEGAGAGAGARVGEMEGASRDWGLETGAGMSMPRALAKIPARRSLVVDGAGRGLTAGLGWLRVDLRRNTSPAVALGG